nr:hypothetical protein [Tanacetum cinerariifolium]
TEDIGPGGIKGGYFAQLAREIVFAGICQAAGSGNLHSSYSAEYERHAELAEAALSHRSSAIQWLIYCCDRDASLRSA